MWGVWEMIKSKPSSNMTPREEFRLLGELSEDTTLDLIEVDEAYTTPDYGVLNAAQNCLSGPDFLQRDIEDLQKLAKTLRGVNRTILSRMVESLKETQEAVVNSMFQADKFIKEFME